MGLRYTGGGYGGAREGFPARDLSAEEVEALGEKEALATGLYEKAERGASKAKSKHEASAPIAEPAVEPPAEQEGD